MKSRTCTGFIKWTFRPRSERSSLLWLLLCMFVCKTLKGSTKGLPTLKLAKVWCLLILLSFLFVWIILLPRNSYAIPTKSRCPLYIPIFSRGCTIWKLKFYRKIINKYGDRLMTVAIVENGNFSRALLYSELKML